MESNLEAAQLINTAIIKSKERVIDGSYEDRLSNICKNDAITALNHAVSYLSESKNISRDQAAVEIIETVRKLDSIWSDYVMMEGINKIKDFLK